MKQETSIFKDAYFGKPYKTKSGRTALYIKGIFSRAREKANYVELYLEPNDDMIQGMHRFYLDGTAHDGHEFLDIIPQ